MRCAAALVVAWALIALGADVAAAQTVPGEIVVRFRAAAPGGERAAARASVDARVEQRLPLPDTELLKVPRGTVAEAVERLSSRGGVRWAEPNFVRELDAVPNDPQFNQLWGLRNTGQTVDGDSGPASLDIAAASAWDITTGSAGNVVAVVDGGISFGHFDLAFRLWANPGETGGSKATNGIDDDGNGLVDDFRGWDFLSNDNEPWDLTGHGTHVAGTIGAEGNNGIGVTGVNWNVQLMPLRVCFNACSSAAVASAFSYAGAKGAAVANASLGGPDASQAEQDAIEANPGTLYVVAAGNGGNDGVGDDVGTSPHYPCAFPSANLVCVAATGRTDALTSFSNFGSAAVDVAAPGKDILSTVVPPDLLHADNFEGTTQWDLTGGFSVTQERSASPTRSITDSPGANYAPNVDATVTLNTPFNFVGRRGCLLSFNYRLLLGAGDSFHPEYKLGPAGPWTQFTVGLPQTGGLFLPRDIGLEFLQTQSEVRFRFRLDADGSGQADGAHLDDVRIRCSTTGAAYDYFDGTSMASPHVAGAAALVRAGNPAISTSALKDAIVRGVDLVPSLYGKVAAEGRIDVRSSLRVPGDVTPPVAFPLTGPANNAFLGDPTPELAWSATGDVLSGLQKYQLRIDRGSGLQVERDRLLPGTIVSGPATPLADGAYTWSVRAFDKAGNTRDADATRTFTIDTIAPASFDPVAPAPNAATANDMPFFQWESSSDAAGSGIQSYEVVVDNVVRATVVGASNGTSLATPLSEGLHQWFIRAKDKAGNTTQTTLRALRIDKTSPTNPVQLTPAAGAVVPALPTFTWEPSTDAGGSGIAKYIVTIDGFPNPDDIPPGETSAVPTAPLADGPHTWRVIAHDRAGNVGFTASRTFTVDSTGPSPFALREPADGAIVTEAQPTFAWDAAADPQLAGYELVVDGEVVRDGIPAGTETATAEEPIPDGMHEWTVRARDTATNATEAPPRSLVVDTLAPLGFDLIEPADGAVVGTNPTFRWNPSADAGAGIAAYRLLVDGSPIGEPLAAGATQVAAPLASGPHRWAIEATDGAGRTTRSAERALTVAPGADGLPGSDALRVLPDRRAPRLSISGARRQLLLAVLRRGFAAACRVDEPAACVLRVALPRGSARRLGLRARRATIVGTGRVSLKAAGRRAVRLRLGSRMRRVLRGTALSKLAGLRFVIRAEAVDAAGNRAKASRVVRLRL